MRDFKADVPLFQILSGTSFATFCAKVGSESVQKIEIGFRD